MIFGYIYGIFVKSNVPTLVVQRMAVEEKINQHERGIGRIEGTLESLATKEFVQKEISEAIKAIDAKIDKQTKDLGDKTEQLSDKIERERSWRIIITGGASILALVLVAIFTSITTLVTVGIL